MLTFKSVFYEHACKKRSDAFPPKSFFTDLHINSSYICTIVIHCLNVRQIHFL